MRSTLAALFAATAVVAGAASGTHAQAGARTLVTTRGRITAFAQDGRYLAWAAAGRSCGQAVSLYDTSHRRTTLLTRPGTPGCRMEAPVAQLAVATQGAQARALWSRYETGNNYYHWLFAGSTQQPRERDAGLISESTGDELRVSIAGEGPFLGLGWAHATEDPDANLPYTILDGGVKRLGSDLRLATAPGLPAAAMLAAGGGRVAIVSRGAVGATTSPRPDLRDVEIRDGSTLAVLARVTTDAPVRAVAVSRSALAVLVPGAIEVYSGGGTLIEKRAVPPTTAQLAVGGLSQLAVRGSWVSYRVGNSIYLLGRSAPLATAASTPIGLSADGGRLTWAENAGGHGRIRAVTLP